MPFSSRTRVVPQWSATRFHDLHPEASRALFHDSFPLRPRPDYSPCEPRARSVARPKGGTDRAFTVPLAKVVLDLLRRRREENFKLFPDDQGWVIPMRNTNGHVTCIQETKEQRDEKRQKVGHLPSPHRLRDTFATAGHEAKLHPMDLKLLMNHALRGGDVTAGYVRPSVDHLRDAAEAIAAILLGRMRPAA
jgi:integrase